MPMKHSTLDTLDRRPRPGLIRRIGRYAIRIVAALLLVAVMAIGVAFAYLRRSLPELDRSVTVAGLLAPVEIMIDRDSVPHIFAGSKLDALFGLGYMHAQERLWQMELQRRIGQGRLAEIFGAAATAGDRFSLTVGFHRAARSAWAYMPEAGKQSIEAYVAGINAFIVSRTGSRLPPEFTLLRIRPDRWEPPDVLVWSKILAWDLGGNYTTELLRRDVAAKVGPARAAEALPPYPVDGLNILDASARDWTRPTPARKTRALVLDSQHAARFATPDRGDEPADGLGSNNWVVDGTRSATGKPMLASDPHLGTRIPSVWYLAHLSAGDFEVIGATIPGLPGVIIGHNRRIAWGMTNLAPDVQDLFQERLDATGRLAEFQG